MTSVATGYLTQGKTSVPARRMRQPAFTLTKILLDLQKWSLAFWGEQLHHLLHTDYANGANNIWSGNRLTYSYSTRDCIRPITSV